MIQCRQPLTVVSIPCSGILSYQDKQPDLDGHHNTLTMEIPHGTLRILGFPGQSREEVEAKAYELIQRLEDELNVTFGSRDWLKGNLHLSLTVEETAERS